MSMSSGFFESNVSDTGEYDRVYYANQFAHYFSQFIGNGIFANPSNQLQVISSENSTMTVIVNPGNAFIDGYWFLSTEYETLNITAASGVLSRYDAVVIGMNGTNREITLYVKEGKYAESNPEKPEIEQNESLYELCLAYIYLEKGTIEIKPTMIEDTRPNEDLCGWVVGVVQQVELKGLYTQMKAIFDEWFEKANSDVDGLMSEKEYIFDEWFKGIKTDLSDDVAGNLENKIEETDREVRGYEGKKTVFNEDGSITITYDNGRVEEITFDEDNNATQRMKFSADGPVKWEKTYTINDDGSVTEKVTVTN